MSFVEFAPTLRSSQSMVNTFYQDEYATLAVDDDIPCITLTLNGVPRYSEHYEFVQKKRLELMNREVLNYPRLHMLTDSRTAGPVLDEDVHYFKTQVMPAMERAGIRCLAIVMPSSKITQLTIRDMTEDARLNVRFFDNMRDARNWLRQMSIL